VQRLGVGRTLRQHGPVDALRPDTQTHRQTNLGKPYATLPYPTWPPCLAAAAPGPPASEPLQLKGREGKGRRGWGRLTCIAVEMLTRSCGEDSSSPPMPPTLKLRTETAMALPRSSGQTREGYVRSGQR
jgi:hypothetical protein